MWARRLASYPFTCDERLTQPVSTFDPIEHPDTGRRSEICGGTPNGSLKSMDWGMSTGHRLFSGGSSFREVFFYLACRIDVFKSHIAAIA